MHKPPDNIYSHFGLIQRRQRLRARIRKSIKLMNINKTIYPCKTPTSKLAKWIAR